MSRPSFPWASTSPSFIPWRTRHLRTGDTTPPSRPQGAPDPTRAVPYHEKGPTGHYGGLYEDNARAMGLGEPPTADVINRAIYDISCALDTLFESYDANLAYTVIAGAVPAPPDNEIDLRTSGSPQHPLYLGRYDTTPRSGPDPEKWCSNYVKLRLDADGMPPVLGTAGNLVEVLDVRAVPGGLSLYTALPLQSQVYPYGMPGTISVINNPGGDDNIEFLLDTPPTGLPVPPAAPAQSLFNYSLMERLLGSGALVGASTTYNDCFTTCYASALGPPAQYTVNRVDLAAIGWLAGDKVYTSHFAYTPTLVLTDTFGAPTDVIVWLSRMRFASMSSPDTSRFADLLRFVGPGYAAGGIAPFTVAEPPYATQYSFDYANALFRGQDADLRGTIGFDFRGGADHQNPGAVASATDAYSGFMHRKIMAFDSFANTVLGVDEPVSWDAAGTVTITDNVNRWLKGAIPPGSIYDSLIIPGIDLAELDDGAGMRVLVVIVGVPTRWTFNTLMLDGASWTPAPGSGTLRIYRPQFRTGMWDSTGAFPFHGGGTLFVGDSYAGTGFPAITAFSLGDPDGPSFNTDIFVGYGNNLGRDIAGAVTFPTIPRFRVTGGGDLEFSGDPGTGLDSFRGRLRGVYWAGTIWQAGATSWTDELSAVDDALGEDWINRGAHLHFAEDAGGDQATYLQLSTASSAIGAFGVGDHAGLWMGLPGDDYPIAGLVVAGNRDAGYVFAANDGGDMILGLGFTTAGGLRRDLLLMETPTTAFPPAGQFPSAPARLEMGPMVSIGWSAAKTFYNQVSVPSGQPRTGEAWLFKLNYDGGGSATERLAWESPPGTVGVDDFRLAFPVNLPHGATVTTVTLWFFCTGGGATVTTNLTQCKTDSIKDDTNVSSGATAIGAGATAVDTGVGVLRIDNDQYFYQLWAGVDPDSNTTVQVYGARITYTMQDILPA